MKRLALVLVLLAFAACSVNPAPAPAPPQPPSPTAEQNHLETIARAVLMNFVSGRYDEAAKDFDAQMLTALPPAKLAEVWKQFESQLGAFRKVLEVSHSTETGYRVVTLLSEFEKTQVNVRVVFDGNGKVAGLFFQPPRP